MSSRGKMSYAAGELVFGVKNPAFFLRKILGFFSMAKRQNSSMQHKAFSHSGHKNILCFFYGYNQIFKVYDFA